VAARPLSEDQLDAVRCGYSPDDNGMATYYLERKGCVEGKQRARYMRLARRCIRRLEAKNEF
jgi:hypothetical protein